MVLGRNTVSGEQLTRFVERVEALRSSKKQLSEDEALVMAEAKAGGFVPAAIRHVLKVRAMKPTDRQEAEAIVDGYLHALGMASDTPLFRRVGLMDVDITARESVIEALKQFVPENGAITVEAGGRPVRLTRDDTGEVTAAEVVEKPKPPPSTATSPAVRERPAPPAVDADEAEAMGVVAFKSNTAIIANPFPFGDARRPRWDAGWRKASGTDGMGPGD